MVARTDINESKYSAIGSVRKNASIVAAATAASFIRNLILRIYPILSLKTFIKKLRHTRSTLIA